MLSRIALRLLTLEALCPSTLLSTPAQLPTLARECVFDSLDDAFDGLKPKTRRHFIAVYTDDDDGIAGQKPGGAPFNHMVDLMFEIGVMQADEADTVGDYAVFYPSTDPEIEASLDLLETQITLALLYSPRGFAWRKLTGSIVTDIHSVPHRSGEERFRIARRTVRWKTRVPEDKFDPLGVQPLPEPFASVIASLPDSSYAAAIVSALEAAGVGLPVPARLETVALDIAADGKATPGAPHIQAEAKALDQD